MFFIRIVLSLLCFFIMTMAAFAEYSLVTDDASTLGKGHFQVMTGVSFFYDKSKLDDVTTIRTDGAEASAILTAGLGENLDIVLTVPYLWMSVGENGGSATRTNGISDILVDFKWRFFEKNGWEMAVKPGVSLPSGNDNAGLGRGRAGFRLFFIATREFEPVEAHLNLGYIRQENTIHEHENIWLASLAVEYEAIHDLKLFGETGIQRNPSRNSSIPLAFISGGLAYNLTKKIAVDASVGFGLTDPEVDTLYTMGITFTF